MNMNAARQFGRLVMRMLLVMCLLAAPCGAQAQGAFATPAGVTRLKSADGPVTRPRFDIYEMDRYAGYGMVIGTTLGLTYGLVADRDRAPYVLYDTFAGFSTGVSLGMLAYLGKLVIGR